MKGAGAAVSSSDTKKDATSMESSLRNNLESLLDKRRYRQTFCKWSIFGEYIILKALHSNVFWSFAAIFIVMHNLWKAAKTAFRQ